MFLVTFALDAGSGFDILYIMLFGVAILAVLVTHWNRADHEHSSLPHNGYRLDLPGFGLAG